MSAGGQGEPPSTPSPDVPPEPGPGALRRRIAAVLAWLGAHSSHVLVVGLASTVVGGVTTVVATGMWEKWFGDHPPACPGPGCDGKNPQKEGCSADAVSWQPVSPNPVGLHARYSKYCSAVWARIVTGERGDVVTLQVRNGSAQSALVEYGTDQFTPMASVGSSFNVKICAVPKTTTPRAGQWTKYCAEVTEKTHWKD
ncbi:DUF2690 domain-containing protein [Streptomyces stramineus]|uniref:DUF2690 domain-containing protein n=1 Tax=Streptomyces stramineus TaxID=173861 RepID=A0ABP3JIX1_9ACTN